MSDPLIETFRFGDVHGIVRRGNPRRDQFYKNRYSIALLKLYPEAVMELNMEGVQPDAKPEEIEAQVTKNMAQSVTNDIVAALQVNLFNDITQFFNLAVHIVKIEGLSFKWPDPRFPMAPESVQAAFEHYLETPDLYDQIEAVVDLLERPNGVVSSPIEMLSEVEAKDPLSSPVEMNGVPDIART